MSATRTTPLRPARFGRIPAVFAALLLGSVGAAEPVDPAGFNPYGRHAHHNAALGNAAAAVAPDPIAAGTAQAGPASKHGDAFPFVEVPAERELNRALENEAYCSPSRTTAGDYASCRLAAVLVQDPVAVAERARVRPEVLANGPHPSGSADLGHKIGEAARVAQWGVVMLNAQLKGVEAAALSLVPDAHRARVVFEFDGVFKERSRRFLREEIPQSTEVRAVHLLTAEFDAMKATMEGFEVAAEINAKGARVLANDDDPSDPYAAVRAGPIVRGAEDGAGPQGAPHSPAPGAADPGPVRFPSRFVPARPLAGNDDTPPSAPAGSAPIAPGALTAPAALDVADWEPARQLAYDTLRAQGIEPSALRGGGTLSSAALNAPEALAGPAQAGRGAAPGGRLDPPASPFGFDRSAAEAAADRYLAIVATPARDSAAPPAPRAAPTPALFARASDVYRRFPVAAR
jgi:hypothetical protein